MVKICAGIVTYNPEYDLLQRNINSIRSQVSHVFIVDNGSLNKEEWLRVVDSKDITIIWNSINLGIAAALNQLCRVALDNGYDWIITLDHDSVSPDNLIDSLSQNIADNVAVVAPNIVYKNNEEFANQLKKDIEIAEWVITSASLTNLSVWKELDGFDEKLFIDGVDRDFCIRANRAGYRILKDYHVKLLHELGNLKCRKCFGRTIYVTNHSPIRKYYMARNAVYLDRKLELNVAPNYVMKLLTKTILYEDKKCSKIKSILTGVFDAKKL